MFLFGGELSSLRYSLQWSDQGQTTTVNILERTDTVLVHCPVTDEVFLIGESGGEEMVEGEAVEV